jgi:hypothetical protein
MGRYYTGDIEGKFCFGVQSSYAADRFGCEGTPSHIHYHFDESHIDFIESELKKIEDNIDLNDVKEYYEGDNGYSLSGIHPNDHSEYADYMLGRKILEQLKTNGECYFESEL